MNFAAMIDFITLGSSCPICKRCPRVTKPIMVVTQHPVNVTGPEKTGLIYIIYTYSCYGA